MKLNLKALLISLTTIVVSTLYLIAGSLPIMAAQAKSMITLTYEIQTDRQENQYGVLLAKVVREDGYPLSERSIAFFESTDVFGTARVSIGTAVTSAVGIAALRYETRQLGLHNFTVVYSGDETTTSAIVDIPIDIAILPPMDPLVAPIGLEHINKWTLIGVGIVTLAVWVILIGVFFGTIRGITANSKKQ